MDYKYGEEPVLHSLCTFVIPLIIDPKYANLCGSNSVDHLFPVQYLLGNIKLGTEIKICKTGTCKKQRLLKLYNMPLP